MEMQNEYAYYVNVICMFKPYMSITDYCKLKGWRKAWQNAKLRHNETTTRLLNVNTAVPTKEGG